MAKTEAKKGRKTSADAHAQLGECMGPAELEARLRAMIDSFDGFIYICSRDYRIEYMNERLIARTGRDGTGELCYRVLHERDEICPWCINERVFAGETVHWEIQSPKDRRWYSIVNTPIYNPDGTLSKQALIRDISDAKRTEGDLKHALDRLEHEVEIRTAELQMKNRQLMEEIAERRTGRGGPGRLGGAIPQRHRQRRDRHLPHQPGHGDPRLEPPDAELVPRYRRDAKPVCHRAFNDPPREEICPWCPTAMTLRDGQVHESVTETPSGDGVRNYRVVSSPVLDKDGRVTAAIEMVDDITEHLRAQQAVADSEARYRTIFETTGTATMIVEEDMTISMVNAEFVKESGFSKAEIEGKRRWTEFIHEDDLEQMKAYHVQRRIDPESVPRSYEIRFRDRGGRIRNVNMTVSLIPGTKKSVASLMDITVRKQAEERLKESERFLARRDQFPARCHLRHRQRREGDRLEPGHRGDDGNPRAGDDRQGELRARHPLLRRAQADPHRSRPEARQALRGDIRLDGARGNRTDRRGLHAGPQGGRCLPPRDGERACGTRRGMSSGPSSRSATSPRGGGWRRPCGAARKTWKSNRAISRR